MESNPSSDSIIMEPMLNHVFWPRVLPQKRAPNIYTIEMDMLRNMMKSLENLVEWIPEKTLELFQGLQRFHTECTPQNVSNAINSLKPGDTFAMFISRQRCAIMIHVPPNEAENVIVASIPGSLYPSEVYSHDSDVEYYPKRAIKVKFSQMLRSKEFANQLCLLNEILPIENKPLNCVSEWLLTLLMDKKSTAAKEVECPVITKKIRDEILGENDFDCFRRSCFYLCMKALLQHSLTMQLDGETGKSLYKIVMLKFLNIICASYKDQHHFDIDLLSQMIAKLARRIEKLPKVMVADDFTNLHSDVIAEAKGTIKSSREKIDSRVQEFHKRDEKKAELPPMNNLDFRADAIHKAEKLQSYLDEREKNSRKMNDDSKVLITSYERYFKSGLPSVDCIDEVNDEIGARIFWLEFERVILYDMQIDDDRWNEDVLWTWSFKYAKYSEIKYKENPLFISRMLLVRLKIIAMLDKRAIKKYPLLKEHRSGIDHNMIDCLLLPQRTDMNIAFEIEKHFRKRNDSAKGPSLIEETTVSSKSFSVKFARDDSTMKQVLADILKKDKTNVKLKKTEWEGKRAEYQELRTECNKMICTCDIYKSNQWYSFHCTKCNLRQQSKRLRVMQYEHLLPKDKDKRFGIVFELKIPEMILELRDVLNNFNEFVYGSPEKSTIEFSWNTKFPEISSQSEYVTLGSTKEYQTIEKPMTFEFETIIVENESDCTFHCSNRPLSFEFAIDSIKSCTFTAQDEYADMQWAIDSTQHTENRVLSSQSECGSELTLLEYKKFGTLRADGHRLQIRKLYERIATGTLSSEKESVLSLVMQTLWECGVSGEDEDIRESHVDFSDVKFCEALIHLLHEFAEQNRSNWKHPIKLLTATLIAVRAFEINDNEPLADEIAKFLCYIRGIVSDWIVRIGNAIRDMGVRDENTERNLRFKLIYVAIVGGMTFFVHPRHNFYSKIFGNSMDGDESVTALRSWLRFNISLRNNVCLYTNNDQLLPSHLRIFLRLMESVGIALEHKVTQLKEDNEIVALIQRQWPLAEHATFEKIDYDRNFSQILRVKVNIDSAVQTVTIDIITGSFLVDGLPLSRLPDKIIKSKVYQSFFGNVVFEVQPGAHGTFSTDQKYNGCSYKFQTINRNIIITERGDNAFEKELIDQNLFSDEFPYYLVNNYSHWWNKNAKCIEFRLRTFGKKHFSEETSEYQFDLNSRHLIHVQSQRKMLNIKSSSYKQITEQVQRLEHAKYIHVLLVNDQKASVEMLRMNLKFTVELSKHPYVVMSNEFNQMRVSHSQKIGTLCGLKHGLVLESIVDGRRIILIPNAQINIKIQENVAMVRIETENELQRPPFYQYQVDEFCRQLKSSNGTYESWFYLAYLHAITSHGEVEPFTGMSGTERALQILQSAFVWSSSPYSAEAVKLLEQIAQLTPLRKFKKTKQIITWPDNLPTRAAQDCFVFIAGKLLTDSQRLRKLHGNGSLSKINLRTELKLNERDHRRCQQFNPNLCVSDSFIEYERERETSSPSFEPASFSNGTMTVCMLANEQQFQIPNECNLKRFLTAEDTLTGLPTEDRLEQVLNHSIYEEFRNLWISLYDAAVKRTLSLEEFTIIFSFYAHRGEQIKPILALQVVAMNPQKFFDILPPPDEKFKNSSGGDIDRENISKMLMNNYKQPANTTKWSDSERKKHEIELKMIMDDIKSIINTNWPCSSIDFAHKWPCDYIDFKEANAEVNKHLKIWHANHMLNQFINDVEERLSTLRASGVGSITNNLSLKTPKPKIWSKTSIVFEAKVRDIFKRTEETSTKMKEQIEEAKSVWEMGTESKRSAQYWWDAYKTLYDSDEIQHLVQAGIFPRLVPSLLLPRIMDEHFDSGLKCLIGAYATAIAREQRDNRNDAYRESPELKASLDEVEEDWKWIPSDCPEWLLFEIEQNLTIRRIQSKIANRMIADGPIDSPNDRKKHFTMQLNMGEGKTAVIVPIVAAKLANGEQACQIMVLKSLFATNLKTLRQYLGGLLNRRIYIFPCRRNLPIESHIHDIQNIYEKCKEQKGVILTIPEHRLSFQLKIYETISLQLKIVGNRNFETANNMLKLHKWTNANVRTVLDESDAILHAKYQLIYTAGKQSKPDAGSQRWLIAQALLKKVPSHMRRLHAVYGPDKIEFGGPFTGDNLNRTDVFTPCRILDENIFAALKDELIDDFLNDRLDIVVPGIDEKKAENLRHLLHEKIVDQSKFRTIEHFSKEHQNTIMILSGYLRFEILKMAMTKRWRVNYGVDAKGKRKMAIPFKAKDVAAENTEFGHPDVAVCFTQMSYYRSGLSDPQLYQVFSVLESEKNAGNIYAKWIESIPVELVDPSIVSYRGVNLDDPDQRDNVLFPLFKFNVNVIDFWLSNIVYEQELKVFEKKLMCTSWDLCSEHLQHRVTGFSGTNDTKNILPMPIEQNDLKELEKTNDQMRATLMEPRNSVYQGSTNVSGKQILQELITLKIPILLDSGALMLELSNKDVAIEWLKLDETSKYDAAVYFDESDTLQTIDRNGNVTEFQNSVYREDLSKCVVYLDDEHTRGTDLKFSPDCRACVTLSGDITRDKTVQSCMRMRRLASTQSILFWPSYEASIHLRKLSDEQTVACSHVMEFIQKNSEQLEKANLVHWTTAALNYTKKLVGHKLYESSTEADCLEKLYNACVDNDSMKLHEMYGEKEEKFLSVTAYNKFNKLPLAFQNKEIRPYVDQMKYNVVDKLNEMAADIKKFTHALDDEQEKELEQEFEVQMQVDRPPKARLIRPEFDKRLKQLVLGGVSSGIVQSMRSQKTLLSISKSLSEPQMFDLSIEAAWADHIFVTRDFHTVVDIHSQNSTDFLRPVCWIARIQNENPLGKDILILLSSFECNRLLPYFRRSKKSTLFQYHPRLSSLQSNLLHETGLQVTGIRETNPIDINDEVQIGVFSGSLYFRNETEQNAYCGFLGLVPRPWTQEQQEAFNDGFIDNDGFVPVRKRTHQTLSQSVSQCVFENNPKDLAIELIKAHHQQLPKDSHVASILVHGKKALGGHEDMQIIDE